MVSYSFTANNSITNRTANLTLLGYSIPVTQSGIPLVLNNPHILANGSFQFFFNSVQAGNFRVVSSTNLTMPLAQWTVVGSYTNVSGTFQFTAPSSTNSPQRFYRVRSP